MLEQIKASAGSGKTHALTLRFLEQLCRIQKTPPAPWESRADIFSEILAMTFTNKAATEMKARVLNTLKRIALGGSLEEYPELRGLLEAQQASSWLDTIICRYDSLNIRTIDSLLNLLVRLSAVLLFIPPDFELTFDEETFFSPLYDAFLDAADRGDTEAADLLEDCAAYLLEHSRYTRLTPHGEIRRTLFHILSLLQNGSLTPCIDENMLLERRDLCLEKILKTTRDLREEMEKLRIQGKKDLKNMLAGLENYLPGREFPSLTMAGKESFAQCCLKNEHILIDESMELAYRRFSGVVAENRRKLNLYMSALALLPYTKAACLFLPEINRLQKKSSRISGKLLPLLAEKVLDAENGVSEACCRLGSRLNHLLIDEFQDTSRAQWAALEPLVQECLARGGSLYYVGDTKQAIYSWRGGDSSLFDEVAAKPSLAGIEKDIRHAALEHNWRSSPEIVRHNNLFFSRLGDPEYALKIAARLLPSTHPEKYVRLAGLSLSASFSATVQKLPERSGPDPEPGFVLIQKVKGTNREELYERVLASLASLFTGDLLLRRRLKDIAVLVRTGAEADAAAQCLLNQGISVITEHSFSLGKNPLILRLVSFLRFLDYPPDDLNFMTFVTGPEIFGTTSGLEDQNLLDWEALVRKEQNRKKRFRPLFRFFARDFPEAWNLWLEPFYRQSGLMSAYDTVCEILKRYALFARMPEHGAYLRRFLEILLTAEKSGLSSLTAFLDYWEKQGKEEKVPSPENPDAVRITTIHKAKGLEFKVVVIPFHRFSHARHTEYALLECEGVPVLTPQNENAGEEYYLKKNTRTLEDLHLLYVAWTRAEEELYAFVGGTEFDMKTAGLPRVMDVLLEDFSFSPEGLYTSGVKPSPELILSGFDTAESSTSPPPPLQSPVPDWQPMSWLPTLKIFRNPVPEQEYDQRTRGVLFHNCLENIYIAENIENNLRDLPQIVERALERALRSFPLPGDRQDEIRRDISASLLWFCSQPQVPGWLRTGRAEQVIMDGRGAGFRMDLLVEDDPHGTLVLEYKSGQPHPSHLEQIRHYLALLKEKGSANPHGLLVYLDKQQMLEVFCE
jgi:ATP-dependent exoDNAse (exonuclease V) beta subunit